MIEKLLHKYISLNFLYPQILSLFHYNIFRLQFFLRPQNLKKTSVFFIIKKKTQNITA